MCPSQRLLQLREAKSLAWAELQDWLTGSPEHACSSKTGKGSHNLHKRTLLGLIWKPSMELTELWKHRWGTENWAATAVPAGPCGLGFGNGSLPGSEMGAGTQGRRWREEVPRRVMTSRPSP